MLLRTELIIDSFAGGGGASLGIAWALGRAPDIAINHDAAALAMHEANHPSTMHVLEDVWKADLRKLVGRRKVGLLWASPDCKHFSRAKGGKPVEKSIRSLAWIVCKWAEQIRPRMIALENVREFADWGPLVPRLRCVDCGWSGTEGKARLARTRRRCPECDSAKLRETDDLVPCPARKGLTFRRFTGRLRNLGYTVDYRNLDAADYGAPTHRKRLFLVARRDGEQITWPEPTHTSPKKLDSMPLFGRLKPYRTAAECIDWSIPCPSIFERKKPLAEKTMRRIAEGIKRYVLESSEPFIVQIAHGEGTNGRWGKGSRSASEPLGTIHAGGGNHAVVTPFVAPITHNGNRRCHESTEPLPTITTAHRGELAIVSPTLIQYYGKKSPGDIRASEVDDPVPVVPTENRHALVSAFLAKHFGGVVGTDLSRPSSTATAKDHQSLVAANLIHLNHGEKTWNGVDEPLRTQTTANHAALVYSFLVKYFGTAIGANLLEPMHAATAKDRFGLVTVSIDGEPFVIVDIGMRMLTPRELARAQGFPDTYILTGTKTSQVARIGNSVCPHVAAAIIRANVGAEVGVA